MATQNLGRVRPVYQGTWNSTDTYVALDRVTYTDGNIYEAVTAVPANTPPSSGTSDSYWALIGASDARITAIENSMVHKTGNEEISGFKKFTATVSAVNDHYALDRTDVQSNTVPPSNALGSGLFFRAADASSISSIIFYDAADANVADGLKTIAMNCGGGTGTTLKQLIMRNDGLFQWGGQGVTTDDKAVHKTGNETIAGGKAFTNGIKTDAIMSNVSQTNDGGILLQSGTAWNTGGYIALRSNGASYNPGQIELHTHDENANHHYLSLGANGKLRLDGQDVTTDDKAVHKTGNETIGGVKTFSGLMQFSGGAFMARDSDDGRSIIVGGSDFSSSYIAVAGKNFTDAATVNGEIILRARDSNANASVNLKPNGSFTCGGNKVLTGADVFQGGKGPASTTDVSLPSGGTWKYMLLVCSVTDGSVYAATSGSAAGGTNLTTSYAAADYNCTVFAIKTAD